MERFILFYQFTKAAHSLCTATVSTIDIKEELTETAVRNWLHGAECFWWRWQFSGSQKLDHLNNIWWTAQMINLFTNQHLPLVLPVCPLREIAITYHVNCAIGSTLPLAMSTQSVDRAADGTELFDVLCLLSVKGFIGLIASVIWGRYIEG
jgi:hypothetical protein